MRLLSRTPAFTIGCSALALLASASYAADPVAPKFTSLGRGPTVVFVHDLGGARTVWMPTARKLIAKDQVVMVDLPGHGDSALPDPFSFEACGKALALLLAAQKPESTVIVGQGMGGLVALHALQQNPGRARGLLLVDVPIRITSEIPDQFRRQFERMLDENYDVFLRQLYSQAGRDSAESAALYAQASLVPPVTMKAYMRSMFSADATKGLQAFKGRIELVTTGRYWPADKDWPTVAKERGYPDPAAFTPTRIVSAGRFVAKDQPDSLAAAITGLIDRSLAAKKP